MIAVRHILTCVVVGWLASHLCAADTLDDVTLRIKPGSNQAAGMNRPEGEAQISLIADDVQSKLAGVKFQPKDPAVLEKYKQQLAPCSGGGSNAYQQWVFGVAAPHPNINLECLFTGQIVRCTGTGGPPPSFEAAIVHIDIDVDSDNTTDSPLTLQKDPKPQRYPYTKGSGTNPCDEQEAKEDPQGSDDRTNPGLLLVVNHGFEQIDYAVADPKDDWARPNGESSLKDQADPDLAKGRIQITGKRDGYLSIDYQSSKLRIWRTDKPKPEVIKPGASFEVRESPKEIPILLEGLDPGGVDGSSRITVHFRPDGSQSGNTTAKDIIKVTVVDPRIVVNRDRSEDGIMLEGKDLTDKDRPFVFWYNNDSDAEKFDEEPTAPDFVKDTIPNIRDLEDFAPMIIQVKGIDSLLNDKTLRIGLRWMDGSTNDPAIKVFRYETDLTASANYLVDEAGAKQMLGAAQRIATVTGQDIAWIDAKYLKSYKGALRIAAVFDSNKGTDVRVPTGTALPEPSKGRLALVIAKGDKVWALNRHHWFEFGDARRYYEHYTAGDKLTTEESFPEPDGITPINDAIGSLGGTTRNGLYDPELSDFLKRERVLMLVHGYRMRPWERRSFAETMLKRLFWQRFVGRMVFFSWPTDYVDGTWGQITNPQNYDRSEFQARRTGTLVLPGKIRSAMSSMGIVPNDLTIAGHSMGNIVVSECLRTLTQLTANKYIALQSAEAAGCYKWSTQNMRYSSLISPYSPDMYRFSSPRQPRSLVTWNQWSGRRGRERGPIDERLVPMADGVPYHIGVSHGAAPTRITYYNKDDAANTFAWNFNQLTKPDSGFVYRWDLLNQEGQGIGPLYSDVFRVRAYNNTAPFSALPGQGRSRYPVWNAYATDPFGTVQRAAILSFLIESHTGSVGAAMDMTTASTMDPWGQPLPAGAVEAPFTDKFNLQWVGIAGDNLDHSAEFNWNVQKMHDFYSLFMEDL